MQVPGAGRGVFATRDIKYGELLHAEWPMLCYPAHDAMRRVREGTRRGGGEQGEGGAHDAL